MVHIPNEISRTNASNRSNSSISDDARIHEGRKEAALLRRSAPGDLRIQNVQGPDTDNPNRPRVVATPTTRSPTYLVGTGSAATLAPVAAAASRTSSATDSAPVFAITRPRCTFTVLSAIPSSSAIFLFG